MFSNFGKWIKKMPLFRSLRNVDFIGSIDDMHYYRVSNKTKEPIILKVTDTYKSKGLPGKFTLQPGEKEIFGGRALNAVGKEEILEQVYDGRISFQPLDIEYDTDYRISNRTARRIGIINYNKEYGELVFPPFGTRIVNSELLKWFKFLEWQRQDLIRIEREEPPNNGLASLSRLWAILKLLPEILLVALAGFGIPLWIVYYFGNGSELLKSFINGSMFYVGQEGLALIGLGRLFQVVFICIASILPALFYYLFGRQQLGKLREKFFHDILVLDPHLYTLSEAEAKYDTLLSAAFGSGSSSSPLAILLLIFCTALLVTGWTMTITPYGLPPDTQSLAGFFTIDPSPLALGFLGVYFFSINMIFRRYVRSDLTPKTYAYITVRLLVSLVLIYAVSVLSEFAGNSLLPVAFIIGVFPDDGFRIIRDAARRVVPGLKGGNDEKYPLTDLEGMNQYDQARLLEEGIENIENLAHHNLIELLALTRIPTARLVDMFDQAILYLHLGIFDQPQSTDENGDHHSHPQNSEHELHYSGQELLKYLKTFGVRTATDLAEVLKDDNARKIIEEDSMLDQLVTIRATYRDDEWLSYIMNWRKESSKEAAFRPSFVKDPYDFYDVRSGRGSKDVSTDDSKSSPVTASNETENTDTTTVTDPSKLASDTNNAEKETPKSPSAQPAAEN